MGEELHDNHAVLMLLCLVLSLYILCVLWARNLDRKDLQKLAVSPLIDNANSACFYELTVYTGLRLGAGTQSNVSFVLAGNHGNTGVRLLGDEKGHKPFVRGSINKYLLGVVCPLGPLSHLHVWLEGSGIGHQSWYLSKIVCRELFCKQNVYVFPCNRWLTAEKEVHLLPVAFKDLTRFGNIFFTETRKCLTDSQLWNSLLSQPTRNNFTRVQRVSCIFSLVMMSMLASAMFHQVANVATNSQGYTLGPVKFTLHEVYISIVSSVVVFPVSLVTDQLFRRSQVRVQVRDEINALKQPSSALSLFRNLSRLNAYRSMQMTTFCTTICKHTENVEYHNKTNMFNRKGLFKYQKMENIRTKSNTFLTSLKLNAHSSFSNLSNVQISSANVRESTQFSSANIRESTQSSSANIRESTQSCSANIRESMQSSSANIREMTEMRTVNIREVTQPQGLLLPHWCVYLAWGLVVLTSALSGSLTWLLSLQWGRERSLAWLTSMLLAVLETIMILQPMKIILVAMFVAALKPKSDELTERGEWRGHDIPNTGNEGYEATPSEKTSLGENFLHHKKLPEIQSKGRHDPRMFCIVQEIAFCVMFLLILILIANHHRDNYSYRTKETILNVLSSRNNLSMIRSIRGIWLWLNNQVIPALYLEKDWNNRPLSGDDRGLIATQGPLPGDGTGVNRPVPGDGMGVIDNRSLPGDGMGVIDNRSLPGDSTGVIDNGSLPGDSIGVIATQAAYRVGPVRLRQQRVTPDVCKRACQVVRYVTRCRFDWFHGHDDTGDYQEGWVARGNHSKNTTSPSSWVYHSFVDLDGIPYLGELSVYNGGGYVTDLIGSPGHVTQITTQLEHHNWIDQHTRLLTVEFTVYNPNTNLFTNVQIAFELPSMGHVVTRSQIFTFRLFPYHGGYGRVMMLCELAALGCMLYCIGLQVNQLRRNGRQHFQRFWNCFQFLTLLGSVACMVMYVVRHALTSITLGKLKQLQGQFYNFQRLAVSDEMYQTLLAFLIVASVVKLIHILRFNRRMSMLSNTLKLFTGELSMFSLVFAVVMVAFVSCGHFLFGAKVVGFRSFMKGCETMMCFMLGNIDFQSIVSSQHILGPAYIFVFFSFVLFILMNTFVTILNEAFTVVHKDVVSEKNEFENLEFVRGRLKVWLGVGLDKMLAILKERFWKKIKSKTKASHTQQYTLTDLDHRLDRLLCILDNQGLGCHSDTGAKEQTGTVGMVMLEHGKLRDWV
ncbi:polycystic kidney disease protein 1-like 2 isoform X2 [Dreissena polymorpha]|uniref:polycystic kidney disease protein 1-like 2 isoform X2 n=1 Tax=Dreissena polymorpha TaxID=45954 RepID=UPI0022647508|nr:polycystic kidney disease protein 1-like 2 isoform X2 [Dreissena polymorpha]